MIFRIKFYNFARNPIQQLSEYTYHPVDNINIANTPSNSHFLHEKTYYYNHGRFLCYLPEPSHRLQRRPRNHLIGTVRSQPQPSLFQSSQRQPLWSGSFAAYRIKFNADWEAGALFRYEKFKDYNEYVGVGIYGEWSFMRFASELRLITEAHATFNAYVSNGYLINGYNNTYPYKHTDMTEVGFTPCIAYRIAIVR